jgi:anti-sigma factor RsiW
MKPETLETLLLDQAMGELSPEVAELLGAHLSHDPEAAQQAAGVAATVRLARQAVAATPETPRRPLAMERLRKAELAMRRRALAWQLARLAACGVIGTVLGWQVHSNRSRPADGGTHPVVTADLAAVVLEGARVPEARKDFWSLANLEAAQRERQSGASRPSVRYRLRWDSPVKMPQVEEDL